MALRKVIEIDRGPCNGCGMCTMACAEGALGLDGENKAVLLKDIYCDGLGACLDVCPTGALKVVERDAAAYDSREAYAHVLETRGAEAARKVHGVPSEPCSAERDHAGGCPGSRPREILRPRPSGPRGAGLGVPSELSQWPIQLHLVSPLAPYFENCDLLVAADCTAFALGGFHPELLRGRKLVIACPKLDETSPYLEKLAALLRNHRVRSLTVAVMTVPCCSGLMRLAERAVELAGVGLEIERVVVDFDGSLRREARRPGSSVDVGRQSKLTGSADPP
jgi:ferredoxin